MKSAITISLVEEARGGPFVFWDGLEAGCASASRLGFDGVEVFAPGAEAVDAAALGALLQRHSLSLAAMGTGAGWLKHKLSFVDPDAAVRRRAAEFVGKIIDLAGSFGAPAIIGSMQGRWGGGVSREQAQEWLGEGLEELASRAARHDAALLYEPLNRYETNLFVTIGEASRFIASLNAPNLKTLCDLYHMNIEEANLGAALRGAGAAVGHIHFADSNRRAMGLGHTDMAEIAAALRDIGYNGYISAEILPLPSAEEAARQTIQSFRRWFREN